MVHRSGKVLDCSKFMMTRALLLCTLFPLQREEPDGMQRSISVVETEPLKLPTTFDLICIDSGDDKIKTEKENERRELCTRCELTSEE